ncbi:MAG: glycoside hydrolase family 16 protein, partial [Gaiellaceae bacterium]
MRLELEFEDTFEGATLDPARWLPFYLPHWSSRERAAARYELCDGVLRLRIEARQQPWCPEFDGEIKVSSLQTGARTGQHRFNPAAVVREQQPDVRLYTARYGRIEVRARATDDPEAM